MRLIALQACAGVAALLFIVTLVATAVHRARRSAGGVVRATALSEYVWVVIPWLMVIAAAVPAVRRVVADR